jgi:D-aminopeptidase
MAGQEVQAHEITSTVNNFRLEGLEAGEYMVRLTTTTGMNTVKKVTFL